MTKQHDNALFETKVRNLISATMHLDVARVVLLRRLTLADPESLKWITLRKLERIFDVLVTKSLERDGHEKIRAARENNYAAYVPDGAPIQKDQELALIGRLANTLLAEKDDVSAVMNRLMSITPRPNLHISREPVETEEPAPLFVEQLPPKDEQVEPVAKPFTSFDALFDETLSQHLMFLLEPFWVPPASDKPDLPFILSKDFAQCLASFSAKVILPKMRQSRSISSMELNHNWAELGGNKLIEILSEPGVSNPIRHNWDLNWENLVPAKGKKLPKGENPWVIFKNNGAAKGYTPPASAEVKMLQDILRWEREDLDRAWRELDQLYTQEFTGGRHDQAREGAFRDALLRWDERLPPNVGAFFAIKSHYAFDRIDVRFLRKLLISYGRNEVERARKAPILAAFVTLLEEKAQAEAT